MRDGTTREGTRHRLDRRCFLGGASALALGGALALRPQTAVAKLPVTDAPNPYLYRFKLGSTQATVVSDGVLPLGPPKNSFIGLSPEELKRELADNFLNPNTITSEQNILVPGRPRHLGARAYRGPHDLHD